MPHIFAVFNCYKDVNDAVENVIAAYGTMSTISVIMQQHLAETRLNDVYPLRDPGAIVGGSPSNLDALLIGRQPIWHSQLGKILMAGPLARPLRLHRTPLIKTLLYVGLSRPITRAYHAAVQQGKVLAAIHHHGRLPNELIDILYAANAQRIDFAGGESHQDGMTVADTC